ncbi:MAG: hypothetical protein JSW66_04740 [Phycisphaerales bacterium]|nr:MAG: hypothetical protein JSW66_04740 [Phycisphaerales bacterium]
MDLNHVERWVLRGVLCVVLLLCSFVRADWEPAKGPLMTRWAKEVSPDKAHPEYPRPQMVRKNWCNLNGLWEYAICPKDQSQPQQFGGRILVPFPIESALSGVMKPVGQENRLWYRRTFKIPAKWMAGRMLLHFGAVDWDATVCVNGTEVGRHRGGYDPFTFDITGALKGTGSQEIVVGVWDPTNAGHQPRGKQVKEPRGIWYTAVTGIWQTVWLEAVPETYIESIKIVPELDSESVRVLAKCSGETAGCRVEAQVKDWWFTKAKGQGEAGKELVLKIKKPKRWSPDSPFLYDLKVTLRDGKGRKLDAVSSYFGMRKIEVRKDKAGINRLWLNDEVLFQFGPLDQGWWPDGLYAAPTDAALRYDIEVLKKLGCNMLRKHVKVEPARLYYWCDKLGLMVWQDMPNGDRHIRGNQADLERSEESAAQFELELTRVIRAFRNHPCIVMWVPFNEGWGQYDTARIVDLVRGIDPSRLVNNASGWADRGVGDVHDIHRYPGPAAPPTEENRAAVLGEFGGLGLPVKGHTWQDEKNWGYRSYKTREELTDAYVALIENLRSLIGEGLSAAVYTQTTDVEIEVNGLMTYDRAMVKMDAKKGAAANKSLYLPPPVVKTVVPASQRQAQNWRYTMSQPGEGWEQENFDDSAWQKGPGGFGTEGTPGAIVRTQWKSSDIWLRRTFELGDDKLGRPQLLIHHDEDAEVYINGRLVGKLEGYTSSYTRMPMSEEAAEALKAGKNCLAIHCRQTTGGQYIDAGLVSVTEKSEK